MSAFGSLHRNETNSQFFNHRLINNYHLSIKICVCKSCICLKNTLNMVRGRAERAHDRAETRGKCNCCVNTHTLITLLCNYTIEKYFQGLFKKIPIILHRYPVTQLLLYIFVNLV